MKKIISNTLQFLVAAFILGTIGSSLTGWSQGTLIEGITSNLAVKPVLVDNSGVVQTSGTATISGNVNIGTMPSVSISGITASGGALPTTYSGTQAVSLAGATYTFSTVAVTNASTFALTGANASRKALIIQNNSTLYNIYVGTTSPVTATSGLTLYPGNNLTMTAAVPLGAWYALGTSSVAQTTQVGEGN